MAGGVHGRGNWIRCRRSVEQLAEIGLLLTHAKGVLAKVAAAVSATETDITHIDMGAEKASETTELRLTLAVRDRQHLADVLRTLKRSPPVLRAARIKP